MAAWKSRRHTRSWRNLLLNASYQLEFTMVMVVISVALMSGLGWWVLVAADNATQYAIDNMHCTPPAAAAPPIATDRGQSAGTSAVVVEIEEKWIPADREGDDVTRYQRCEEHRARSIANLYAGKRRIFWVLVVAAIGLSLGLAVLGIKMTHRVAGPLHKVARYFAEMQAGHYGAVDDLRKGDQLVGFYRRFKAAHEGMRGVEAADIEVLRELVAVATSARVAERDPKVAAALDDLRRVLTAKEGALET